MLKFSEIKLVEEDNPQNAPEKNIQNEPLFTLIEDLLNMQKIVANETALVSEMPILIDKENVIIIAPRQGGTLISLLHEDTYEEVAFPCLFPKGKFGYIVFRDVPVSIVR